MMPPVFITPFSTASALDPVRSHCSRIRESRNTS